MTTLAAIRTGAGLRLLRAAVSRSGFEHPRTVITWSDALIPELASRPQTVSGSLRRSSTSMGSWPPFIPPNGSPATSSWRYWLPSWHPGCAEWTRWWWRILITLWPVH